VQLHVIVATLEGCSFSELDDPRFIERLLTEAVAAGGFTMLHSYVHEFEPQGVTGAAVLSESHIAVHTWPEHGLLFVDIATCSGEAATEAAFARMAELVRHERVVRDAFGYASRAAAAARPLPVH
jgi:S-adenosylmethionine decarboxylase